MPQRTDINPEQDDQWLMDRCGSLGASQIHEALAKTKSGWGASRSNIMSRLVVERLTGIPSETYQNADMERGLELEPEARSAYEFYMDVDVELVGVVRHPEIKGTHASPDGLVGKDGLVEIKVPKSATHIDTLLGKPIDDKYIKQMTWQMACTGRQYCDFASYDPRLPEPLKLHVQRVERDEGMVSALEKDVAQFLADLDDKVAKLNELLEAE